MSTRFWSHIRGLLGLPVFGLLANAPALAQATMVIAWPERTRLLEDQRVDLVIEIRHVSSVAGFRVTAAGRDLTSQFRGPLPAQLDCDETPDVVFRADAVGFPAGHIRLQASASTPLGPVSAIQDVLVYPFQLGQPARNIILFIGDGMSQPYRDAARLVARSTPHPKGVPRLREGFFDDLLEMDQMPIVGWVITHSLDRVVPDSANTASAWATGNKIQTNGLGVFPDGTDCRWRLGGANAATLEAITDNPKVETLWEYLKRRFNYRTGIVSTADIADATPAGEAAHVAFRQARFEVIRQHWENPFLGNRPAFGVILGGGWDQFLPSVRSDGRDLVAEFRNAAYRFVSTATELRSVTASTDRLLGLFFQSANPRRASDGIRAAVDPNMSVAYDKLRLRRLGTVSRKQIWATTRTNLSST